MTRSLAIALLITISLTACSKDAPPPPAAPTPPAAPAAPTAAEAPAAPADAKPGAALSVSEVGIGTALGPDGRVGAALEEFAPSDTIIVAISLNNAGTPAVNGVVTARWLDPDGAVFNEESQQKDFGSGTQTVSFRVAEPKGFKPGAYTLEVSLNGSVVDSRNFNVK